MICLPDTHYQSNQTHTTDNSFSDIVVTGNSMAINNWQYNEKDYE